MAFCSLRSLILANNFLPVNWALAGVRMGLPHHLNGLFRKHISSCINSGINGFQDIFLAGIDSEPERFFNLLNEKKIPFNKLMLDQMKSRFKFENSRCYVCEKDDRLTKHYIDWYIGLEKEYGNWIAKTINVKVSLFIRDKLNEVSLNREKRDREEVELRDKIVLYQNKVYSTRSFPEKLKQIIFQRDDYKCQICCKNRDLLIVEGLHLEVDHIIEWEDGGETTYKNGQTLCSACNKGKYHAKKHLLNKQLVV